MSPFIVHSFPGSPFARSVMATLEECAPRVGWLARVEARSAMQSASLQRVREPARSG